MTYKLLIALILSSTALAYGDDFLNQSLNLTSVQEEIHCEQEFGVVSSAFRGEKSDRIICQDVKWLDGLLQKVANISPNSPTVNLEIYSRSDSASFDIGRTIHIPLNLIFRNQWGQTYFGSPMGVEPIAYHEYAHAVFTSIFAHKFYPNLRRDALALSEAKIKLQRLYAKGNPAGMAQVYERRIEILMKGLKKSRDYRVYEMTTSYNEFFADLLAVLISNDKDTIMNALYYDQMTDQKFDTIKLRSFSNNNLSYSNAALHEKHGELAFVRKYVGQELLNDALKSNELKKELVDLVIVAIDKVMSDRVNNGELRLNPKKNNEDLINAIKKLKSKE